MKKTLETEGKQVPTEVSLEDGKSAQQLRDILDKKAKEKLKLQENKDLHILKKSRFYYNVNAELREHIATYKGYAILLKQENLKEEINTKENKVFPSLVTLEDLKKLKRVNGNVIRKLQPNSLHEYEKMALIQGVMFEVDKGV